FPDRNAYLFMAKIESAKASDLNKLYNQRNQLYREALTLWQKLPNAPLFVADEAVTLAQFYYNIGQHETAVRICQRVLEIGRTKAGLPPDQEAAALMIIGDDYLQQQEYTKAEPALKRALLLYRRTGNGAGVAASQLKCGLLTNINHDYDESEARLKQAV